MKTPLFAVLSFVTALTAPALSLAAEQNASQSPYVFLFDAESLAGYSEVGGSSDGDFSTSHKWLTSLGYKSDPSLLWIAAYNGSYDRTNLFITQEEGAHRSTKLMTNNFSLAAKKDLSDRFTFRPVFFYNVIWVEETADESLGKGLYDYEDIGGGFENTHTFGENKDARIWTYGAQIFGRTYPNFSSLLSLFDPNGSLEANEKDFVGYKGTTGYQTQILGDVQASVDYTFLFKDYTDKRTINNNGIRESGNREDVYQEVRGTLFKRLQEWIGVGFTATFDWNSSNLDFYDTRNTAGLGDDRFFSDYYDYTSFEASPTVILYHKMDNEGKQVAQLALTYSYETLYYSERNALDRTGGLRAEEQEDRSHLFSARLSIPLSHQISWVSVGSYKEQDSNQKFEQFYSYIYDVWSAVSGISYKY